MKITQKLLARMRACGDARKWFAATFPEGAEITPENLARCERDDWVCWLACKLSKPFRFWCAGVAFREAARRNPSLEPFSMNVTESNCGEARKSAASAADAADAAADAADAAAYAAYAAADAAADAAAAAASDAAAYAAYAAADAAARKRAYAEMRAEAVRVLLAMREVVA